MKIRSKLLLNAVVTTVCVLGLGITGYVFINKVANVSLSLFERQALPILKINEVEKIAQVFYSRIIVHTNSTDPDEQEKIEKEIASLNVQLTRKIAEYKELEGSMTEEEASSKDEKNEEDQAEKTAVSFAVFIKNWEQFNQTTQEILELSRNFAKEDALSMTVGEAKKQYDSAMAPLQSKIKAHKEQMTVLRDDAISSRSSSITWLSIIIIASFSIGILGALVIIRSITMPIDKVVLRIRDIAEGEGDLTARLEIKSKDEVGELSEWFNIFMEKLQDIIKDVASNAETLGASSSELSSLSGQMSQGADNMSGKSNTVASAAEEMSSNTNSVAAAMEQAATNVNMVATAAEEMTATVNEIAQNSENARTITNEAVSQARRASEKVDELGSAANEISKVTEVITEISEQTNLLALNATIEAARAGEAGKGFAVVANEIKELAKQTADATQEIKKKIEGIQGSTSETVTEIGQISKVINDVNEIVSTIATAVEEQSVTTQEIAGNVAQASQGLSEVNQNVAQSSTVAGEIAKEIADVNQSAGEMSSSSSEVNLSVEELNNLAEQLKELVGRFKV